MKPKQRFVETFFDNWSPNMAYILGYFAADGSMYKNARGSHYISFTSTDLELIQTVKKILKVTNSVEVYQSKHLNWKLRFTLQIGSKLLFNKFLKLGFTPAKSLRLAFPPIPNNIVCHFIRGYFDGDGSAYYKLSKRGGRNGYAKHLHLSIRCGNKKFLETLRSIIECLCQISPSSLSCNSNAFTLAYSGRNVIKLYGFLYPNKSVPHLTRKRLKLKEGIRFLGP